MFIHPFSDGNGRMARLWQTALHLKSRETLRRHYLGPALEQGLIVMGLPDKPTSRSQTYIRT